MTYEKTMNCGNTIRHTLRLNKETMYVCTISYFVNGIYTHEDSKRNADEGRNTS